MPLNIDIQQILLHMLNFAILVAAVYFLLYNPIKKFMDNRNNLFDERENALKENEEKAEKAKKEYEEKLSSVQSEADEIKSNAEKQANEEAKKIISDAENKASEIVSEARAKATREHDDIISSAYGEITKLAQEEAEKVVFADTKAAYDCFLDAVEDGEIEEQ